MFYKLLHCHCLLVSKGYVKVKLATAAASVILVNFLNILRFVEKLHLDYLAHQSD